jgi:molybdopterin-guanine dinucleotide biosynthesis protein A
LAGGKSVRMGEDKSLLKVDGKPLISAIANQLLPYFDEVIIGANDVEKYKFLNLKIIPDIEKNKGPLMGILSCLKSSANDLNFITACDIPILNIPFILYLIRQAAGHDIVMPMSGGDSFETLFAVYNISIISAAEDLLKNNKRRIIELFNKVSVAYVEMSNNGWYQNLNTKQNYLDYLQKQA